MILILFKIQPVKSHHHYTIAKVWVNNNNTESAEAQATKKLSSDGYKIKEHIETTPTQKDDYFPPCNSLDTFIQAEQDGIAVLYS